MNQTTVIILVIAALGSLYGIWLLINYLREDNLKEKCKTIKPPHDWDYYFSGITRVTNGYEVSAFIAKVPQEGGPAMKFLIPRLSNLGSDLRIVEQSDKYFLWDVLNNKRYPSLYN